MKRGRNARHELDVVADVQAQTEQAAALAGIAGQDLLLDPALNPATRRHSDRLRVERQLRGLDAGHARALRRDRVLDARAAEAERALEALALARRTNSAARSVLALHRGRRLYLRGAMAASLVLAAGSARGVEKAAGALGAPAGTGYVAELGLTVLTTVAIGYRAHLAEHGGRHPQGWQGNTLTALMVVPLLVSVVANAYKAGALGVACSVGAAAFAVLGYIVGHQSNVLMARKAKEVKGTEELELLRIASGVDPLVLVQDEDQDDEDEGLPASERPAIAGSRDERQDDVEDQDGGEDERPDERRDGVDVVVPVTEDSVRAAAARLFAEDVEAWLADREPPPEPGGVASSRPPAGDGPDGAARDLDGAAGHIVERPEPGHIADRDEDEPGHIDSDRVSRAAAARREQGDARRAQIAAYLDAHPKATNPEIAAALRVSTATVKRHRRALRTQRRENGAQR